LQTLIDDTGDQCKKTAISVNIGDVFIPPQRKVDTIEPFIC